jgi:hypothetical protein
VIPLFSFGTIEKGLNRKKSDLKDQVNRNVPLTGYQLTIDPAAIIRIFYFFL